MEAPFAKQRELSVVREHRGRSLLRTVAVAGRFSRTQPGIFRTVAATGVGIVEGLKDRGIEDDIAALLEEGAIGL